MGARHSGCPRTFLPNPMIVTALPDVSLSDLLAANPDSAARTPGVHATDIVRVIMARIDPAKYGTLAGGTLIDPQVRENWFQMGFLWEELIANTLRFENISDAEGTRFRPGELIHDGVILSPDALYYPADADPDAPPEVEELKCTWKSSRGFDLADKRFLYWTLQMQLYCYAVGTTKARLYVLHVNGDYKPMFPRVKRYRIEFNPVVLHEQWQSAQNTARMKGWL